ncbi:MAG TPA: arginine--tRNA ligase, partial [Bacteroidetes bacterium]|nr:arginine--tRNA ligase [Bacteroidota bacterium]HEX05430.1 arginine--tRNA ligase [Bacteroidota bacterium]
MNLKERLTDVLQPILGSDIPVIWSVPKRSEQGDLSTNAAMIASKRLGRNPREFAQELVDIIDPEAFGLEKLEVAGPGFVNVWIGPGYYHGVVRQILERGSEYGSSSTGNGQRVIVEFVSANPTGPLNIVSARAAAIGDSLVRVMRKAGYDAMAEFYVNDAGRQIRRLGESIIARAKGEEVPDDGYHGEYVKDIAKALDTVRLYVEMEDLAQHLAGKLPDPSLEGLGKLAAGLITVEQSETLSRYRVHFDRWFKESELHDGGDPQKALDRLRELNAVYEKDDAVWFKGSEFGDEEDRVIITSEGRPTYLLPDIAYHLNKADRCDIAIDLLGPDHHDYVNRMQAALKALGHEDFLSVLIVQQVHLLRDGERVKMSKRAGQMVTLSELLDEVGVDVTRYFFLQRKTSTPLDFDLDLALEQSDQNPVYYVQYAHTRTRGILRQEGAPKPDLNTELSPLTA